MPASISPVSFRISPTRVRHSWLPYFLAAVGAGSTLADEEFLRYWWVMPDAPAEKAPRVIRVLGEKGERYEEVYAAETRAELKSEPAILRARLARQTALRKEAVEQARQLRESGKSPLVAYEEAWTRVFAENRLAAAGLTLSSWLEDTLARLTSGQQLTEDEKQLILEALLADDDSLEDEAGQELLRRLAEHLRAMGYGLFDVPTVNDELMQRFAEAMRHKGSGVGAYRDALFKTHRDRVMFHSLTGYHAPWGAGMGRNLYYRQRPKQVGTTVSSGNTQLLLSPGVKPPFTAPGVNDLPGSVTDFLATSPPAKGENDGEESDEEKEEEYQELDESEQVASSLPPLMNTFSMRSAASASRTITDDAPPGSGTTDRDGFLHWDSSAGEPAVWDTEQTTAWVDGQGGETLYMAGSSVEFGNGADLNKSVQVAGAGVEAGTIVISGDGYHFTGGNIKVTELLNVTGAARFDSRLDVGASLIQGGTLENVQMQITGEISRPVTGDTVTVHNLISSADGTHAAVLTDVALYAGTATEYATLYNVVFAGDSDLTGYITIEKTQSQREIGVATGSTLTIDNATFDLRGMASGSKVLIVNGALDDTSVAFTLPAGMAGLGGELKGWDTVKFVYSGIAVNKDAVDTSVAGMVTLRDAHDGNLYWNGKADDRWNPGSANWSSSASLEGQETFSALSNVHFGAGNGGHRDIGVTQDMVVMNLDVSDGDYSFNGARVAVLGNASLNFDSGVVDFQNQLVVQGNLDAAGSGSLKLSNTATVAGKAALNNLSTTIAGDMTVVGNLEVNADTLNISGNVSASQMNITVNSTKSTISGNLTVGQDASIVIGGTAEQHYTGVVTAGALTVDVETGKNDVYFSHLQVGSLTVGEDAHVHVQTASDSVAVSSSSMPDIYLSGTLSLDSYGATYDRGYDVHVKNDAARLRFGSGCTIDNLNIIGMKDDSGYTNVGIEVQSHSATVTKMQDLGNLSVETGSLTVKNAAGAVHGKLILDNGKLKLGEGSDNIMAGDSGAIQLKNGGRLDIGKTSQTLSDNNDVSLSGASSITGEAEGSGLELGNGVYVNYASAGNSIEAKMKVAQDTTVTLNSTAAGSSLEISGLISGSGTLALTGPGTVVLSGANAGFDGQVTVQENSILTLQNTDALLNAGVTLNDGATLALNAPDAAKLNALTLLDGSSLAISSIVGTDDASAGHAVLNVNQGVTFGGEKVELNVIFADELDTMTTYNLMTGVTDISNLSFNVIHNGVALDDSQYKIHHDAATGLLYMHTMMGNVWDGEGSGSGPRYWSTTNKDGNWSSGNGNYDETGEYRAAIFGDLTKGSPTVYVQGCVSPGDVYLVADKTAYTIAATEEYDGTKGHLASGTNIHKDGDADVKLQLYGNMDAATALGNVDIQAGSLILEEALAVAGTVTIDEDAQLRLTGGSSYGIPIELKMVNEEGSFTYTVSGLAQTKDAKLSGLTMDAAGIRGTKEAPGSANNLRVQGNAGLSWLELTDFAANGDVALSHVKLKTSSSATTLTNVTIGEGVEVDASGSYTLSGNLTFEDTLTNNGTLTLTNVTSLEIGKIKPDTDEAPGKYNYQLISLGEKGSLSAQGFEKGMVSINGVNLATGLAYGIVADFKDNLDLDGSFTLSIDNGSVDIPQWDERWGKTGNAPAISRRYVGTDSADEVELAAGIKNAAAYYKYSSIVNATNAYSVNGGKAIVVTLSDDAKGELVAGGHIAWAGAAASDHEVWIYDNSDVENIIGGLGSWYTSPQTAATHILVDSDYHADLSLPKNRNKENWGKEFIIAGSRWGDQGISWRNKDSSFTLVQAVESYVTVKNGEIYTIFGASCGGWYLSDNWGSYSASTQYGTSHVFADGGRIGEIFGGGCYCTLIGSQVVNGRTRAVELVITGGRLGGDDLRVFGGGERGEVHGDIYVRMEGDAAIDSQLVGGSNAGTVNGNIEMDLITGSAFRVDAAGLGWYEYYGPNVAPYYEPAKINGDVQVNLYRAGTSANDSTDIFRLGTVADIDPASRLVGGIYGGMETTNHVEIIKPGAESTLHFAESARYELATIVENGYDTSAESVIVTGFDRFSLENGTHVVLGLGLFDRDMDPSEELIISGKGVVEVIGHGIEYDVKDANGNVVQHIGGHNLGRNIQLEDSATLKISTSVIGNTGNEDDRTITVLNGSTIDFSGVPSESGYEGDTDYAGLGFNVVICGDGVDGKGALYKGEYDGPQYPVDENAASGSVNRIILPNVKLTGGASVKVESQESLFMNANGVGNTYLDLAEHTLTKMGAGDFITRSVEMTPGTILVQQGAFGFDLPDSAADTDVVLAAGAELKLNATGLTDAGTTGLELRSLSGAGMVVLNGDTLTLHTDTGAAYYDEYMDEAQVYDQFTGKTGFGYAVFSGLIQDGSASGNLVKTGSGVHYISGSSSTYTGGTQLQEGRLYLLGSSTSKAEGFTKGVSTVASGVAGTGAIVWENADAELYLGHGARIYNEGTTNVQGGVMTIGVEGALNGVLADFVGIHSEVTMGGEDYVEIDTHNLKSIAVNAQYADGTAYVANADIDRNKMLLVKKSDWETVKDTAVTGFSDTGYNEAVYSGVLHHADDVTAGLRKVGVGTLVLDQVNTYTGGTEVAEGTLRLRGWGTAGAEDVVVNDGASLMLSYTLGYGDAETVLDNDIKLSGSGDEQWSAHTATEDGPYALTDGRTAALISAVGQSATVVLNGDIKDAGETVSGGVLHSGDGTLVLRGDSSYTGGTHITRGVVEVQSAFGLGATASGKSEVVLEATADLRVTVEPGCEDARLVTTLAAAADDIQGDVTIAGTEMTERVLHMEGNGYKAASTTLKDNGTFLLSGNGEAGISSQSKVLSGTGTVVVSDATGKGTVASFDSMVDYTGDFRVEGDNASIHVATGSFIDGSIDVSGQHASVNIGGKVTIAAGESLNLHSTGVVPELADAEGNTPSYGTGAVLISDDSVSVAAGAILSVSQSKTDYAYNLNDLKEAVSLTPDDVVLSSAAQVVGEYHPVGEDVGSLVYREQFNPDIAINQQAVGAVKAAGGLTLAGGSTYEANQSHISLLGGSLTLDTMRNNQITLKTTLDIPVGAQVVLFSDVGSMTFGYGNDEAVTATAGSGVYYTRADRYVTGNDYVNAQTLLVYDSEAGVVYLQLIPGLVPEPATTTLSLLALTALLARRRRR